MVHPGPFVGAPEVELGWRLGGLFELWREVGSRYFMLETSRFLVCFVGVLEGSWGGGVL